MADYNYSTGKFSNKDTLPPGNADKIIKGVDYEPEFVAISTAVNSKVDSDNPVFSAPIASGTIDGGTF
jgi:hypothetical protein